MFGGVISGSVTNKILSATYDSTGTTPTFSDTGATLPGSYGGGRFAIIGSYIYMFGNRYSTDAKKIYKASLSSPTSWSDTGSTLPDVRNDAPVIVSTESSQVAIIKGYSGSAFINTFSYASTSTPTTWATGATAYGTASNQIGAAVIGGYLLFTGGSQSTLYLNKISSSQLMSATPYSVSGVFADTMGSDCVWLHNGSEVAIIGNNTTTVYHNTMQNCFKNPWESYTSALPTTMSYLMDAVWYGGDGRCYCVSGGTVYRSGRKQVYVPTNSIDTGYPYRGLVGCYADGEPAMVSSSVLLGTNAWLTDKALSTTTY
jgi:hypothetical protein